MVFLALFACVLWCVSAWFVVLIYVVMGAHQLCCQSSAEKVVSKGGGKALEPSSTLESLRMC